MRVLGVDSATGACSTAIWEGGTRGSVIASRRVAMDRGQAEALVPLVMETLTDAGLTLAEIDRLAVAVGPGAFTGLRIALAAARGFALAADRPLVGITSFDAIHHALGTTERAGRRVLVTVDSRRDEPYAQLFEVDGAPRGAPVALPPAVLASWLPDGPLLVAGDGAEALRIALAGRRDVAFAEALVGPDARAVAELGAIRPAGGDVRPLYLRPPDVTLPKRRPSGERP